MLLHYFLHALLLKFLNYQMSLFSFAFHSYIIINRGQLAISVKNGNVII